MQEIYLITFRLDLLGMKQLKGKTDELDPDGGIIYTGNADILKEICPGDFGKIKNQGFCMIGVKNR